MNPFAAVAMLLAATAPAGAAAADIGDLRASYEFLVRDRAEGGVMFKLSAADGGYALPVSFRDTADYWALYVCRIPGNVCAVTDTYNSSTYELTPQAGLSGDLQTERVNVHNGANIYDAATWQIAVMLGAVKNSFISPTEAYALTRNLNKVLQQGGNASHADAAPGTKRATTVGSTYIYNGKNIANGQSAYAFRAIAPAWLACDPLMGTRHASLIQAKGLPASNPSYQTGKITWSDWKPITGENAWAFLIGPLQAAHIHHVIAEKKPAVPFNDLAIQNALDVLPAFAAMQSKVGAVYYAPAGTVGNQGAQPLNPHEVSVENNFSVFAGLKILRATLQAQSTTTVTSDDARKIDHALRTTERMIDGLLAFFRNTAWQDGAFIQGGLANDPGQSRDFIPSQGSQAVDVQTWGIAALGARQIDQWFGHGASYELWQRTKVWGAYGVGKTLWGVGYSDRDGNGIDPAGEYRQGVMSAEWTAGAVNAVRNMIAHYGAAGSPSGAKLVASLKADEAAMLRGVQMLRFQNYLAAAFPGKPDNYASLVPEKTQPYLYASRRHAIPFGWNANPLPSTTSTAWMLMLANHYDPFGFGGTPN